jgi:hypothetical protein
LLLSFRIEERLETVFALLEFSLEIEIRGGWRRAGIEGHFAFVASGEDAVKE